MEILQFKYHRTSTCIVRTALISERLRSRDRTWNSELRVGSEEWSGCRLAPSTSSRGQETSVRRRWNERASQLLNTRSPRSCETGGTVRKSSACDFRTWFVGTSVSSRGLTNFTLGWHKLRRWRLCKQPRPKWTMFRPHSPSSCSNFRCFKCLVVRVGHAVQFELNAVSWFLFLLHFRGCLLLCLMAYYLEYYGTLFQTLLF